MFNKLTSLGHKWRNKFSANTLALNQKAGSESYKIVTVLAETSTGCLASLEGLGAY
jgi:hypothetical protein